MSYDQSVSSTQRNIVLTSFAAVDNLFCINRLSVPVTSGGILLCWCDVKYYSQTLYSISRYPLWLSEWSFELHSVRTCFHLNTFMEPFEQPASIVCYLGEAQAYNQLTLLATERSPFSPSHYICSHVPSQPLDITTLINHSSSVPIGDLFNIQMHILHSAIEHVCVYPGH